MRLKLSVHSYSTNACKLFPNLYLAMPADNNESIQITVMINKISRRTELFKYHSKISIDDTFNCWRKSVTLMTINNSENHLLGDLFLSARLAR